MGPLPLMSSGKISVDSNVNNLLNQTQSGFITQESIQHTYPNEDYNVNNIQNQDNSQYGSGSTVIPIEDYNNVLGIAHEWKKECDIKDNAIHARNEFLTGNNQKLQVEYMRNKMLDVENEGLQEENKILELEKESLVEEGNNRLG